MRKKRTKKPVKRKTSKKTTVSKRKKIKFRKRLMVPRKIKKIPKRIKKLVKKTERTSTGIPSFDKMIEGGFEGDSINLVAGGSGSGKSIFGVQYLLQGVKKGEKTLYITFEEKKEEVYSNMKKLGFDLDAAEKSGKFIFLEYSPEKVKMMLDEGGGSIESLVLQHKIKRMVFDSITSFSLLFDDELSKRQSMLALFDIIRKWDLTTLLTVQYDPLDKEDKGISAIEFEADSITFLYFVNIKNKRQRFVQVIKMRGINHSKEIRSFEIKKNGFKIGRKAKIKFLS